MSPWHRSCQFAVGTHGGVVSAWRLAAAVALAVTVLPRLEAATPISLAPTEAPLPIVDDASQPLFPPPAPATAGEDQIFLVSTRAVGTRCDGATMAQGLRCELLVRGAGATPRWEPIPWDRFVAEFDCTLPTVVYVHGNRVDCGEDKAHGLALYRSLAARLERRAPLRYVIWSWPSEQIRGRLKDYQVKAARTRPVGWQLAWAIDQLPADAPVSLVGYSYGARVVTGSLHLLAGGSLGDLQLEPRLHAGRAPVRAALVAAAVDADWLRPGAFHGRALEQVDELLLVNNQRDPAMRFYHLPMEGRHPRALGYTGLNLAGLPPALKNRVHSVDVTDAVGRHHALVEYLAAAGPVGRALVQAVPPVAPSSAPLSVTAEESLAGRGVAGGRQ